MSFSPSNQPFKDDIELKSDLRSDTLDTRQEYDLKVSSHRNTCLYRLKEQIVFNVWTDQPFFPSKRLKNDKAQRRVTVTCIEIGGKHRYIEYEVKFNKPLIIKRCQSQREVLWSHSGARFHSNYTSKGCKYPNRYWHGDSEWWLSASDVQCFFSNEVMSPRMTLRVQSIFFFIL